MSRARDISQTAVRAVRGSPRALRQMTAAGACATQSPCRIHNRSRRRETPVVLACAPLMTRYRVLFINDTARNGGPGRSLYTILKFVDPQVIHRAVVLPRPGPVGELLAAGGAADELHFEPNIVENVVAPIGRAMRRDDFDVPAAVQLSRALGNAGRMVLGLSRLRALIR